MSILIKGMEMPDKVTTIVIFPEGKARVFRQDIDHDEWLTAIEVPKHGDLIDRDAIPYIFGSTHATEYDTVTKFVINKLPTIVEAEDGT